jgi:translation initiation factor 2A
LTKPLSGRLIQQGINICESLLQQQHPARCLPAGFEFVDTKAASKNAKKRANKKSKAPGAGGDDSEGEEQGTAASTSGQQKPSSGAAQAAAGVASLSMTDGNQDGEGGDAAKRVRALQKKLRQIQQLKERLEKEGQWLGCGGLRL